VAELQGDIYWAHHEFPELPNQDKEALASYFSALNKGNNSPSLLIKIGKAYDRERNYREAAQFFERAMKADM